MRREDEKTAKLHEITLQPQIQGSISLGGNNGFNRVFAIDENNQEITEAAAGQRIIIVCDMFAENLDAPPWPATWKLTITAIEIGQPTASAWKNQHDTNRTGKQFSHNFLKLNEYPNGSETMPDRNLNLRIKMWQKGDTRDPYPPLDVW